MDKSQLGKTELEVSTIGLGTVELGLEYGIGPKSLPTEQEAITVLKTAIELGVTYIDTARGYGLAEERIGKSGIAKQDDIVIGTKCAQFLEKGEEVTGEELIKRIRQEVEESLRLLQVDSLQLVQLHGGSKEQIERGELIEIMQTLKDEGKIQHVGIATRGEDAPLAAIASKFFETIQTAYSILDQRMASQVLPQAQEHNVGIINRSVLLKGALTPKREHLPEELHELKTNADKAADTAEQAGMSLPTLAIRFVLSNPAISTALIGTTKAKNIEQSLQAAQQGPLPEDILSELYTLGITTPSQIDPSLWPKM